MRKFFVQLKNNSNVRAIFFLAVILNSIVLAATDFTKIDTDGNLIKKGSFRNTLAIDSDPFFVVVFTLEAVIKIIAMGLFSFGGKNITALPKLVYPFIFFFSWLLNKCLLKNDVLIYYRRSIFEFGVEYNGFCSSFRGTVGRLSAEFNCCTCTPIRTTSQSA